MPHIKTAAVATQNDHLGIESLACYRAAFEVAGIEVIEENLFGFEVTDFAPVVSKLIAANPDLITWDTAYPDYVNLLTEQAYLQGYKGQFVNCTLDQYEYILGKTSKEFLEGFLWQFPDLDDPIMQGGGTHFDNAAAFYQTYAERYPGASLFALGTGETSLFARLFGNQQSLSTTRCCIRQIDPLRAFRSV